MDAKVAPWTNTIPISRPPRRRSLHLNTPEVLPFGFPRQIAVKLSSLHNTTSASLVQSGSLGGPSSLNGSLVLKDISQEIKPYLSGHCVYLVGMMGSGKTTLCGDSLEEQEVGGTSMADIFKLYGEGFFREKETEILRRVSIMPRAVVSMGGGAVMRPINWFDNCRTSAIMLILVPIVSPPENLMHTHKGISVWLDVPLDALAKRIAAIGTHSRPLLHSESGDAYTKALNRPSSLFKERGEAYANADARVSLEEIAAKHGYRDVSFITPPAIAFETVEQMESYLKDVEGVPFDTS